MDFAVQAPALQCGVFQYPVPARGYRFAEVTPEKPGSLLGKSNLEIPVSFQGMRQKQA